MHREASKQMSDLEKSRSELEKPQTLKKLDMAQAKLDAMGKVQQEFHINEKLSVSDKVQLVTEFIESHPALQTTADEVHICDSGPAQSVHFITCSAPKAHFGATLDSLPKLSIPNPRTTWIYSDAPLCSTGNVPHVKNSGNQTSAAQTSHSDIPAKLLLEQISLNRLPSPEPSVFCGDPLKYRGWKAAFEALIDTKRIPNSERIHY